MDSIQAAQDDMKMGYGFGAIGALVSGIVWISASLVVHSFSFEKGMWTLIIGGMFIFPVSTLLDKIIGLKGTHEKNNPLGKLAMEGTVWMIMCIPLAYGLSLVQNEWFFQGMLMIIGGRYLTFNTLYGARVYWIFGAALGIAAYLLFTMKANAFISALTGGMIEIVFGTLIFVLYRKHKLKITA